MLYKVMLKKKNVLKRNVLLLINWLTKHQLLFLFRLFIALGTLPMSL